MNFCRELARRHCDLVITDINGDKLVDARNALSADFPDIRIFIVALDLTDQDVTDRMEAFCALERINPDILSLKRIRSFQYQNLLRLIL